MLASRSHLPETAEAVQIFPLLYNHHHENRYVDVKKPVSISGYTPDGKESYPAMMPFIVKFRAAHRGPMGRLKMIDLEGRPQEDRPADKVDRHQHIAKDRATYIPDGTGNGLPEIKDQA